MRFQNRTAVITGAAQGIGEAIARRLAREGCALFLLDVNDRQLAHTRDEFLRQGWQADCALCDVSNPQSVDHAVQAYSQQHGRLDFLVNNAGIFPRFSLLETPDEVWSLTLATNLSGAFFCTKRFLPLMESHQGAAIVNISSGRALQGAARGAAYAASKSGILGFTKSAAQELAPRHIRVNAVVPGITDTAQPRQEKSEAEMRQAGERIPLGRIGEPQDVAAAVAYLLSEDAAFITGHTLVVNGGAVMV